ncbi:MAG: serine/threonine protein kinase [Kiritimatiellae bacterium]|nr:serine/threonine protein kinase [Kiritimatiellia bacterium]MCO5069401.1 serine/threonine protein kinase [Kiritimatiellia bacterium]
MTEPESPNPAGAPLPSGAPTQGFKIGDYVIIDTLGHGSMATVYLARDVTGHEVALKVFQEGPGVSPTMLERFKREAEASKKLRRHPNIMKVYATGQDGAYHYIVMEPIRNSRTLEDLMESQPLSMNELLEIGIKIARALHYAHSRNIFHRDVKPSNIMVDEFGEPLLTDFGVAELVDWPSMTISGALTGTPLYMSPEQARMDTAGPQSDIYSLGVVLYEAITGMLPYSTQHSAPIKQVLEAVKTETPRRLRHYRRDISPDLEAVILKAIEKNTGRRYHDAESFASDLERARTGRRVSARLATTLERLVDLARRYDQFFVAAAVMLAMASGGAFYLRSQLLNARYANLLSKAHLRNLILRGSNFSPGTAASDQPTVWNEIRMARRDMAASKWVQARDGFAAAIALARSAGDARTASLAALELARCEIMLGRSDAALGTYHDIIVNSDASPVTADMAQLEAVQLALLHGAQKEAVSYLNLKPLPIEGPLRDALRCLSGEISAQAFADRLPYMPERLRNDFHLALAIRYRMEGNESASATHLRRVLQFSAPSSEWPAPFARALLEQRRN